MLAPHPTLDPNPNAYVVRCPWLSCWPVPTILEATGLSPPSIVNGVTQRPLEGVSMVYTFNNGSAEDTHQTQYFEM